jgi:hypothetical protein
MLGLLQTYGLPFDWNRRPAGRWWKPIRRRAGRLAGRVDERAGPRPITEGEFAGSLSMSLDAAERLLRRRGLVRNPFARSKTRRGTVDTGSWVYRASPLARRQHHVMLFRREDGGVDVYAHEEPSSVHPLGGAAHFRGRSQRVAPGVDWARETLPLDASDASVDPVDGPWHANPSVDRGANETTGGTRR